MTARLMPHGLLVDSWMKTDFVKIIARFSQCLACLTGMQSKDLRMLLQFAFLVAWFDFEPHRNKVSFVFR